MVEIGKRIQIKFIDTDARVTLGPSEDSKEVVFSPEDIFVICHSGQQDFKSGSVKLILLSDSKSLPTECFLPIKAGQAEFFEQTLKSFEEIAGGENLLLSAGRALPIHSSVESSLHNAMVVGPDFLRLSE